MPQNGKLNIETSADGSVDLTGTLLQLVLKVTEVLSANNSLNQELSSLKEEMSKMREDNMVLLKRVEDLENSSNAWSQQRQSRHLSASSDDIIALTSTVADEMAERKGKEKNIVIQGLQERNTEATEADTLAEVNTFLTSLKVDNPQIARAFRMGQKQNNRPRLVKVMCSDEITKERVLSNAKQLKQLPNGHVNKNVFIRHDLTRLQRNADFKRRQENRNRLAQGTEVVLHQHDQRQHSQHGMQLGPRQTQQEKSVNSAASIAV